MLVAENISVSTIVPSLVHSRIKITFFPKKMDNTHHLAVNYYLRL
jgi:hypothetical protein